MNQIINLILSLIFILFAFEGYARTILTPKAEKDYNKRLQLQPQLRERMKLTDDISSEEREALTFLYAYLPTPDVLDYDAEFFLRNLKVALQASEEMPWGKIVPDREWRHFVLPVRVNNEDLDLSREQFYDELRDRVKNLSMEDAILEVNHWCHEKVSYQPSDPRTSSPLATVGNALGRCGEESTFTVAALRSIGIPARQVYTPRWAHTDDNHAWVEAWANGKWHFLGACEPEAVLDLAWFNAPSARGMLMTTKVTGVYDGPEEILESLPVSTVINVTENYAPVALSSVCVKGRDGKPVKNAKVRFCLYNYAEFYPLTEKLTDDEGVAQFVSGVGDLIVWASDGERFNLAKLKAGDDISLILEKDSSFKGSLDFDLTPPVPGGKLPEVSEEAAAMNISRKVYEDSVRHAYVNTFLTRQRALEICRKLGLENRAADLLVESRGNHEIIEKFLYELPDSLRSKAVELLTVINEKDLHDVTPEVLYDNIYFTSVNEKYDNNKSGDDLKRCYLENVLNPRIEYELLRPFKEEIGKILSEEERNLFSANPEAIGEYIRSNIATDSIYNPESYRQSAVATLRNRLADPLNKAITFVAVCRALGIPARLDPISGNVQYSDTCGSWKDVVLTETLPDEDQSHTKSILQIRNECDLKGREPKYYSHFTVSRMEDGLPCLMEFDYFETLESVNNRKEPIVPGQYFLLSGQRLADGTVLARGEFFQVDSEDIADVPLLVRQDEDALQVIGSLNAELLYTPVSFELGQMETGEMQSILSTTGRGYYVLGIVSPGHEPSAHALNDISAVADEFAATGRKALIMFPDKEAAGRFRPEDYGSLPANVLFGIDGGEIAEELKAGLELARPIKENLPTFVVADSFNRIIFSQQGYAIRLGETLARILNTVE